MQGDCEHRADVSADVDRGCRKGGLIAAVVVVVDDGRVDKGAEQERGREGGYLGVLVCDHCDDTAAAAAFCLTVELLLGGHQKDGA